MPGAYPPLHYPNPPRKQRCNLMVLSPYKPMLSWKNGKMNTRIQFRAKTTTCSKVLRFPAKTTKIVKILRFPAKNDNIYENTTISSKNDKIYENATISIKKSNFHWKITIFCENSDLYWKHIFFNEIYDFPQNPTKNCCDFVSWCLLGATSSYSSCFETDGNEP